MKYTILLSTVLLLAGCAGLIPKTDEFGSYRLIPSKTVKNEYSVMFDVPEFESEKDSRNTLELRASKICRTFNYLIKYFYVFDSTAQYMSSAGGNAFYTYDRQTRVASGLVVCNPTDKQIVSYKKIKAKGLSDEILKEPSKSEKSEKELFKIKPIVIDLENEN